MYNKLQVPELCAIHPFTASLWRQAVCLPCILYRMNALLLSNNVRLKVATQIRGLGTLTLPQDFKWKPLSFGWSLSDIMCASDEKRAIENKVEIEDVKLDEVTLVNPAIKDEFKAEVVKENGVDKKSHDMAKERKDGKHKHHHAKKGKEKDPEPKPEEPEEELSGFAKAAKEPLGPGVSLAESLLFGSSLKG